MRVKELVAFIKEREAIHIAKDKGVPRGLWTKDPILGKYRFCNVRREDDRVTMELKEQARLLQDDPNTWFWWVVARLFNKPATMQFFLRENRYMGNLSFAPDKTRKYLKFLRASGPIFNGAYIVSTNGKSMDKVDYIIDLVLKSLWKDRKRLRPTINDTLDSWHTLLMTYDGLGSFMAAQIVADMKYVAPLDKASDWWTFAASGPGSRRGLNRVMGCLPDEPWSEAHWRDCLTLLRSQMGEVSGAVGLLHAQDVQNCLCEFDKYERARLGEGTPKQIYKEK